MNTYAIELQQPGTDTWQEVAELKPHYLFNVRTVRRWLLFKREIGVIDNLREAEKAAETRARKTAARLARYGSVRVKCTVQLLGKKTSSILLTLPHAFPWRLLYRSR